MPPFAPQNIDDVIAFLQMIKAASNTPLPCFHGDMQPGAGITLCLPDGKEGFEQYPHGYIHFGSWK